MKIGYSHGEITPEEVVRFLYLTGQAEAVFEEIIKHKESRKKAMALGLEVKNDELQRFADNLRVLRGLDSVKKMFRFLGKAGLTEDDFEGFCESTLLAGRLREHLADEERVRKCFFNVRMEFDAVKVSVILVNDLNLAQEIKIQVTEEGEDFHALARLHSLDLSTRNVGGYMGIVSRKTFPPQVASRVFNASAGDLVGPFPKDSGFLLVFVEEVTRAELNDEVREAVKDRIFQEWLSEFTERGTRVIR